jgi:hypothetical protein
MNAAQPLPKGTTGLELNDATEGVVNHEGRGNRTPGKSDPVVRAERPWADQGDSARSWRGKRKGGKRQGSVALDISRSGRILGVMWLF